MKVYISGPMTGLPDFNFPAFFKAEEYLKKMGCDVVNPARLNGGVTDWVQCMQTDISALMGCDAVYCLQGWQKSKGASLEVHIAKTLGYRIVCERNTFLGHVVTKILMNDTLGGFAA